MLCPVCSCDDRIDHAHLHYHRPAFWSDFDIHNNSAYHRYHDW